MRNKLLTFAVCAILLICSISFPASAQGSYSESATTQTYYSLVAYSRMKRGQTSLYVLDNKGNADSNTDTVGEVKDLAGGILASKGAKNSVQNWIDTTLSNNCASGSEWYIIALSQNGKYDFKNYKNALTDYLEKNMPSAVQTAQKFAIALIATGKRDGIVQTIADRPIESTDSIMAYVFGLHLLNNGISSKPNSIAAVKTALLNMQRQDGGWAIMGKSGDVDVTAMVLQALAPHYNEANIKAAVDRAIVFLSSKQNANGSFSTMKKENCESTAQVITALSALNIDCSNDPRFSKNGNTPLDALGLFRLKNGGFSHLVPSSDVDGGSDSGATSNPADKKSPEKTENNNQSKGNSSVPETDDTGDAALSDDAAQTVDEKTETTPDKTIENQKNFFGYKPIVIIILCVIAGGFIALFLLLKKANRKNIIFIVVLFVAAVSFVLLTNFESVSEHNKTQPKKNAVGTVTISIRCDNVVGKSDSKFIPDDGCILPETTIEIENGYTVFDVLSDAVKENGLHMEKKGTGGMVYISGIQYLYEFQFGDMSGWVYHVNGESPFVGCDNYEVKSGDVIEWMYTLDLGVDTGNSFSETKGEEQ